MATPHLWRISGISSSRCGFFWGERRAGESRAGRRGPSCAGRPGSFGEGHCWDLAGVGIGIFSISARWGARGLCSGYLVRLRYSCSFLRSRSSPWSNIPFPRGCRIFHFPPEFLERIAHGGVGGFKDRPIMGWGGRTISCLTSTMTRGRHLRIPQTDLISHNIFAEYLVAGGLFFWDFGSSRALS